MGCASHRRASLTGVHLMGAHLLQACATRGRAGFDFRTILICPSRHTTVLGGMRWCVRVPPNGSPRSALYICTHGAPEIAI